MFDKIARGEPVALGERGERKWAVPHAITIVQGEDHESTDYPIDALFVDGTTGPFSRRQRSGRWRIRALPRTQMLTRTAGRASKANARRAGSAPERI